MADKNASNVVRLRETEVTSVLKTLLEMAENGQFDSLVVAGYNKDGSIITARANTNIVEQQSLVGYLQADTTYRIIEARINQYEE
jgi:hypothetical protein